MGSTWRVRTTIRRGVALIVALAFVTGLGPVRGVSAQPTSLPRSVVDTDGPTRILDTRITGNRLQPGTVFALRIPRDGNASSASVFMNITATDAAAPGWVRARPCGAAATTASVVNYIPGRVSANAAMIRIGDDSSVCFDTSAPVDLVVDRGGQLTEDADYTGTVPNRILDTRLTGDPLQAGVERRLRVAGTANIPAEAAYVALNLTVDSPASDGWVVAYRCGAPTSSSTMNFNAGEVVANLTLVSLANGELCLRSLGAVELIVDTEGWSRARGALTVQSPARILDTRDVSTWPWGNLSSGETLALRVAGRGNVPNSADAALLTVTVTGATGPGFVTVWPCDAAFPTASTINTWAGQLRSNLALARLAVDGTVCFRVTSLYGTPLDLVVDAVGSISATVQRSDPPPTSPPPTPPPSGPSGGPGCGLVAAAFCDTFDVAHNGGTPTGDLDPTLWGVSRLGDINPGSINNGWVPSHNACAHGAETKAPADVQICNGQMVESVNDGGGAPNLDTYPKQPFNFAGRTGVVVFDVSADSEGTHAAWPEFRITDEPVPGTRRMISICCPPHAQNQIGFSLDSGCPGQPNTTGVGVVDLAIDGAYQEHLSSRPNCITKGSSAAMNHFEVRVSTTRLEVWGTDAGAPNLKLLAVEDIPGGLHFSQGLVWLNDAHYNARKSIEPCECGTQFEHSFFWDNLGFDGPKTYRDLGFDVPYAGRPGPLSTAGDQLTNEGYHVGAGPLDLTVTGVRWDVTPTAAKVVYNAYSFDQTPISVSVNGHTPVTLNWRETDITYGWRASAITVPVSDLVDGTNTLTFRSSSGSTVLANVSLIMVAGAQVP